MSAEKTRNDFIFFQDEILGDIKKVEKIFNEKISNIKTYIETQTEKYDNKIKDLSNRLINLSLQLEEQKNLKKSEELKQQSRLKYEEMLTKLDIKLNILDKDFNNACYKYDKIFTNNLVVPGLIGTSCPYDSLKAFLEHIHLKISELSKAKDKQNLDTKKYKEKLETIIERNKTQIETAQNKINEYCTNGFKQCDDICKDRMNLIENRIETLRIENSKYAFELKQKSEEINLDWEKLNNIEKNINKKYKDEWNKITDVMDRITNKNDKFKEEFNLIKNKFTELSEFIKDVRFRKNLGEVNISDIPTERRQYKELSNRIDFSKKRKTKRIQNDDIENGNNNNNDNNDNYDNNENEALGPYDYYDVKQNFQEPKDENDNNKNNINYNSNSLNEIKKSKNNYNNKENNVNNIKKKEKEKKKIPKENNKENKNINENNYQIKNKIKYSKFYNENNSNTEEIN